MVETQTRYFLGDALGSVRQVLSPEDEVLLAREYSPYGETLSSIGDYETDYSYTGEMTDGTGLVNLRARYYDPGTGRFISKDTWIGDYNNPITLAKWLYANGNPVIYSDPSGLFTPIEGMIIHTLIERNYLITYGRGRDIRLEFLVEGASKNGTGISGFVDIADITYRQLYEIKPLLSEPLGEAELAWYLSFLPGFTAGSNYSTTPMVVGPMPTNPLKVVVAQMRIPGVIVYWERMLIEPVPLPARVPYPKNESERNTNPISNLELQPVIVTCETIVIVIFGIVIYLAINNPSYVPVY